MLDVWQGHELLLFLLFFVPGFIMLQVYGLFVAIDDTDLTKRIPAAVAFSALHYAAAGWLILVTHGPWRIVAAYAVVLVLPAFWPLIVLRFRDPNRWTITTFRETMFKPEASPWDRVFTADPRWIRAKLKDGTRVGGYFGPRSAASTYPSPEQLYISNAFTVDQKTGDLLEEVPRTGLLLNGSEISVIELVELPP